MATQRMSAQVVEKDQWIEQPVFCREYHYDPELIRGRRRYGIWLEGVHWRMKMVGRKKRVFINKTAIDRWMSEN